MPAGGNKRPAGLLLAGRASVPAYKRAARDGRPTGELVAQAFQPVQAQAEACGYIFLSTVLSQVAKSLPDTPGIQGDY